MSQIVAPVTCLASAHIKCFVLRAAKRQTCKKHCTHDNCSNFCIYKTLWKNIGLHWFGIMSKQRDGAIATTAAFSPTICSSHGGSKFPNYSLCWLRAGSGTTIGKSWTAPHHLPISPHDIPLKPLKPLKPIKQFLFICSLDQTYKEVTSWKIKKHCKCLFQWF